MGIKMDEKSRPWVSLTTGNQNDIAPARFPVKFYSSLHLQNVFHYVTLSKLHGYWFRIQNKILI